MLPDQPGPLQRPDDETATTREIHYARQGSARASRRTLGAGRLAPRGPEDPSHHSDVGPLFLSTCNPSRDDACSSPWWMGELADVVSRCSLAVSAQTPPVTWTVCIFFVAVGLFFGGAVRCCIVVGTATPAFRRNGGRGLLSTVVPAPRTNSRLTSRHGRISMNSNWSKKLKTICPSISVLAVLPTLSTHQDSM